MLSPNVYLISRFNEKTADLLLVGVGDCRFRADRMISNDIDTLKLSTKPEIIFEKNRTLVSTPSFGVEYIYTITDIPINEVINIPEF